MTELTNQSVFGKARLVSAIRKAKVLRDSLESEIDKNMDALDPFIRSQKSEQLSDLADHIDDLITSYDRVCESIETMEYKRKNL